MDALSPLFREVFSVSNDDAQDLAADLLARNGYKPQRGLSYVYGPGTVPVLLVAHTDVVHRAPPSKLYHDPAQHVVWAPNGLGADDRAGVYAIASLLARGLRPHVLFPDEEETGGAGAHEAARFLPAPPVRCMIELDRMNGNDAVTYCCDSPSWNKWLTRRGWDLEYGTFTDISVLMPSWGIAGANLSVGYYRQHTTSEHLRLDQLNRTIDRVQRILRNAPRWPFAYIAEEDTVLEPREDDYHLSASWFGRRVAKADTDREWERAVAAYEEQLTRAKRAHGCTGMSCRLCDDTVAF